MDKTTNHTPGPWKIRFFREGDIEAGFFIEAKNNNKPDLPYGIEIMMDDFGDHSGYPATQRLADATLMVEAANVSTETGKTPKQLQEENERLTKVIEEYLPILEKLEEQYPIAWDSLTKGTGIATTNRMRHVLKKSTK